MERTIWLENPIAVKGSDLKIPADVEICPYFGKRQPKKLWHTSYTIGSGQSCDIFLDDPFASQNHAEILLTEDGNFQIRDLASKNGLYVNGTRVGEARLHPGAQVRLGRSYLKFPSAVSIDVKSEGQIVFRSEKTKQLLEETKIAGASDAPTLLTGETGTGKELFARLLHESSRRSRGPFISINCATLSGALVNSELFGHQKGAFTGADKSRVGALLAANKGTLFLDEFGDLPLETQALLLRSLESKEVKPIGSDSVRKSDFRLIAATSLDIEKHLETGSLRKDLFYRIVGNWIQIPALRDRREDITAILDNFLKRNELQIEEDARRSLLHYEWPGNVRELLSLLARARTKVRNRGTSILLDADISFIGGAEKIGLPQYESGMTLRKIEELAIRDALRRNGGSKTQTAKELGVARSTLFEKLKKYKIE